MSCKAAVLALGRARTKATRKADLLRLFAFMQQPVMDVPVADYSFHAGDIVPRVRVAEIEPFANHQFSSVVF